MDMTLWQAVVLGAVQGLTEFLPVSSSAHLVLAPYLLGWPDPGLAIGVALHLGTLLAVLAACGGELVRAAVAALRSPGTPLGRLGWAIALGTLPGGIAGWMLEPLAAGALRHPPVIALALAGVGALLWWADMRLTGTAPLQGHGLHTPQGFVAVLGAGVAQALAVMPGVSRSGATMTAARLFGLSRVDAARASFLLSVPIILGAALLTLPDLRVADLGAPFWAGLFTAAAVGFAAIRSLLKLVERTGYGGFALYRTAVAGLVLGLWLFHR